MQIPQIIALIGAIAIIATMIDWRRTWSDPE